jgi:hypothetical protein
VFWITIHTNQKEIAPKSEKTGNQKRKNRAGLPEKWVYWLKMTGSSGFA